MHIALTILLSLTPLFGQSDLGTISGFIKDPSSASVPNARVVVKNQASGAERQSTSNESGYYAITNIPPGVYVLTAEAPGFKQYETKNNKLDPS